MLALNRRYAPLVIAAIVAAGCWVLSLSTPAGAQSGAWSAPTSLGEYWFPDVAVDASGRVHAVWASGTTGFDAVMYAKRELGGEWSRPIDIFAEPQIAGGSEATRPTLFVDSDNQLHSTHRSTTVFYSQAPAGGAHVATNWRAQLAIGEGYFSRVARSTDGALHLIYTQNLQTESCRICYHVYYVRSYDDGISWSDPQDISLELIGTAKPQLLIDSQQNLHVVWESGLGGSYGQLSDPTTVVYVGSADGGESWSLPYKFDPSRGVTTAAMAIPLRCFGFEGLVGHFAVNHEPCQVRQSLGDAIDLAGLASDRPAHPPRHGGLHGLLDRVAPQHLIEDVIRKVASVAAVQEGSDLFRFAPCGGGNRCGCDGPGGCSVLVHGSPKAPVFVLGGEGLCCVGHVDFVLFVGWYMRCIHSSFFFFKQKTAYEI